MRRAVSGVVRHATSVISLFALLWASPPTIEQTGRIPVENALRRIQELRREGVPIPDPVAEVTLNRVRYASTDGDGRTLTLSGLLAVPKDGPTKGVVLYFHGTTADRRLSPSRYSRTQPNGEAQTATLAFASGGYALLMPDYRGLGDDSGVHPYPWAEDNVQSGLDLLRAARELRSLPGPLYVTGYSEGGAVAMAATRRMEAIGGELPRRSAPLSGPYDLSETTLRSLLGGRQAAFPLSLKLYFLSYAAYAAKSYLPDIDLRNYFAPSFASYIPYVFSQGLPDAEVTSRLLWKALQLGAIQSVHKVLTWRFRQAVTNGDRNDPVLKELRCHDVYDWAPTTPMRLVYLPTDSVVLPANTHRAMAAMRARGATVESLALPDRGWTHITACPAAIAAARQYFDQAN